MRAPGVESVRVIGLGQACVDYLGRIPFYPEEDRKVELQELHVCCGGPASTALVTLARLGVPTSFLGSVSDDAFGLKIIRNLENESVDISQLKVTPGATSQFAFIAISPSAGQRTIFWHRGHVPHLGPGDVDLKSFCHAAILHLDGLMIEASLKAAHQARSLGMTIVMDGGTMREGSKALLALVDVLIASETYATPLVGSEADEKAALRVLRELGPKQVVITLGDRGSVGSDAQKTFRQKAFPVKVRDTTGAGDVYHGGYIYGLLCNWDMPKCMRFASATAALACTAIGAQTGIPSLEEVEALLKK
jgi:ribokinase